jgi:hypothetical protein
MMICCMLVMPDVPPASDIKTAEYRLVLQPLKPHSKSYPQDGTVSILKAAFSLSLLILTMTKIIAISP